jgi:hypothetical protein
MLRKQGIKISREMRWARLDGLKRCFVRSGASFNGDKDLFRVDRQFGKVGHQDGFEVRAWGGGYGRERRYCCLIRGAESRSNLE